jgi:hypothetical protein
VRTTPEWVGKTDDQAPPKRVKVRVFLAANGVCHVCRLPISGRWQCDHVIALVVGGQNRESNLAPVHEECHKGKTREDVRAKSKIARIIGKNIATDRPRNKIPSRPFPKREKPDRSRGVNGGVTEIARRFFRKRRAVDGEKPETKAAEGKE